jgi:hypothetical protein
MEIHGSTSDAAQCNLFQLLYVAFPVAGGRQNDLRQILFEDRNLLGREGEPTAAIFQIMESMHSPSGAPHSGNQRPIYSVLSLDDRVVFVAGKKSFRRRIGKSALRGKTRTHHPAVARVNSKS